MTKSTRHPRAGFTLVELLITISIIAILASMVLVASMAAQEQGRTQKTRALIAKLDGIIKTRYESYRTRRAPITFAVADTPAVRNRKRLEVQRDLMRMELPDRLTDISAPPIAPIGGSPIQRPSTNLGYKANLDAITTETAENQGAECLYMIVMQSLEQEGDSRGVFRATDVADTDGDGLPEFIDGWGNPIQFLRWAPGFFSEMNIVADGKVRSYKKGKAAVPPNPMTGDPGTPEEPPTLTAISASSSGATSGFSRSDAAYGGFSIVFLAPALKHYSARIESYKWGANEVTFTLPFIGGPPEKQPLGGTSPSPGDEFIILASDPFDHVGVQQAVQWPYPDSNVLSAYALYPLIYSAGSDKCYGIRTAILEPTPTPPFAYASNTVKLNPFTIDKADNGKLIGQPEDFPGEPNYASSGWLDNIHNHHLGKK